MISFSEPNKVLKTYFYKRSQNLTFRLKLAIIAGNGPYSLQTGAYFNVLLDFYTPIFK